MTIERWSQLKELGCSAFGACHIQSIDLPVDVDKLSSKLFYWCDLSVLSLASLAHLSSIGVSACEGLHLLRSVLIPGTVTEICAKAFSCCASLSEVDFVLPSRLASIGVGAFKKCKSLTEFWIVGSVTDIDGNFLDGSGVRQVWIGEGNAHFDTTEGFLVTRDGRSIVAYFGSDRDVRIGANIETVGKRSFARCDFLRSVTFESRSKLKRIEKSAFRLCCSLERVIFGGSRPSLEPKCFQFCHSLKEVLCESPSDRPSLDDGDL
jgi:hypothetical protein